MGHALGVRAARGAGRFRRRGRASTPARNAIDRFVLARLEREGLSPAPRGDARRRRSAGSTLDLTGLPPTLAEIDAFLADPARTPTSGWSTGCSPRPATASGWRPTGSTSPATPTRTATRSDRYRADVAVPRLGHQGVQPRTCRSTSSSPGSSPATCCPNATKEQRLATAFNRLHMQNEEGGVVEEEFRVAYVVDRVNTFGTAFLGLTLECSPVPRPQVRPDHPEGLLLALRVLPEHRRVGADVLLHRRDARRRRCCSPTTSRTRSSPSCGRQIAAKEAELASVRDAGRRGVRRSGSPSRPKQSADARAWSRAIRFDELDDGQGRQRGRPDEAGQRRRGPEARSTGKVGKAAELERRERVHVPRLGHFTRADPFSLGALAADAGRTPPRVVVRPPQQGPDRRRQPRATSCCSRTAASPFGLHHMWPGNSLKVVTKEADPDRTSGPTSP